MNWSDYIQHDRAFFDARRADLEIRLKRVESGLANAADPLESAGLKRMQRTFILEQTVLIDLERQHNDPELSLSLEALILWKQACCQRERRKSKPAWHTGHPPSAAYWEAETRRCFLAALLCQYHRWLQNHPLP